MKKFAMSLTAVALGLALVSSAEAARGGSGGRGNSSPTPSYRSVAPTNSFSRSLATTKSATSFNSTKLSTTKLNAVKLPSPKKGFSSTKTLSGKNSGKFLAKGYSKFKFRHWNSRYSCYLFWCPEYCGWFYYSPTCSCYCAFDDIASLPPVEGGEGPGMSGGLPPVLPGGTDGPPAGPGDQGPPPVPGDGPGDGPAGPGASRGGPRTGPRMPPAE